VRRPSGRVKQAYQYGDFPLGSLRMLDIGHNKSHNINGVWQRSVMHYSY